jgi:hypothetical protein
MKEVIYLWTYPKKPSIFSKIIKWRIKADYSHVCIATYIKTLEDFRIYQASHGDVNTVLYQNFKKHNHIVKSCRVQISIDDWKKTVRYMEKQTGKKYSIIGAIASTFKFFRERKIGDNDDKAFICSEYAYRTHAQYKMCHNENADYIEPKQFENIMRKENYKITGEFDERPVFIP